MSRSSGITCDTLHDQFGVGDSWQSKDQIGLQRHKFCCNAGKFCSKNRYPSRTWRQAPFFGRCYIVEMGSHSRCTIRTWTLSHDGAGSAPAITVEVFVVARFMKPHLGCESPRGKSRGSQLHVCSIPHGMPMVADLPMRMEAYRTTRGSQTYQNGR